MKYLVSSILVAAFLLVGCTGTQSLVNKSPTAASKAQIAEQIEMAINNVDPHLNIGVKIISLADDKVVFEKNGSRHFVPASSLKIVTVAAALHYLGASYRFETKVFADEINHKNKTAKNLYLQGSGDPSLSSTHIIQMAQEIKQMGIKTVLGDLIIDDSRFTGDPWIKGSMWDDRNFGWGAPISALTMDFNRLLIKTVPATAAGFGAYSIATPATHYFKIEGKVATKPKNSSRLITVAINKKDLAWPPEEHVGLKKGDVVSVDGQTPVNAGPFYKTLAVADPSLFTGEFFKEQLALLGVTIKGKVERGLVPTNGTMMTSYVSRTLGEALIDFTKNTNNLANDSLVKAIAVNAGIVPATFDDGLKLVKQFLSKEVGIDEKTLVAADGSGLSRYNLVTPDQMIKVLQYSSRNFSLGAEFIASLPIAGMDGTLTRRFNNETLRQNIRAKTGTVTGILGLTGYLVGPNKELYAFAIFMNNIVGSHEKYLQLQDRILSTLYLGDGPITVGKK
jgi:D-alanyl-D-alanine carboxypeptidase/D-alanyl-D-alanine-endopeptidase (penicillin-binding protein 4)